MTSTGSFGVSPRSGRRWVAVGAATTAAVALSLSGASAALAAPPAQILVPCSVGALNGAIAVAPPNAILVLQSGCTYSLTSALPTVTRNLTIVGSNDTIRRVGGTFTVLTNNDANLTITNLTIAGANGRSNAPGAILNENGGALSLTSVTFLDDDGGIGGAILNNTGGALTASSCNFVGDDASGYVGGGAIANGPISTAQISGSTFIDNSASGRDDVVIRNGPSSGGGGAVLSRGGSLTFSGAASTFTDNFAEGNGGAIFAELGSLNLSRATFTGNGAYDDGGAVANFGAAATIAQSAFNGNESGGDGGAVATGTTLNLNYDQMSGNRSHSTGGGLYVDGGTTTLNTTDIYGNRARVTGGGIRRQAGTVTFLNTTVVAANVPNNCSGLFC
jgi:predicted outer membrane repeat protein